MPKRFRLGVIGKRKAAVKVDAWDKLNHPGRSTKPWAAIGELILTIVNGSELTANPTGAGRLSRTRFEVSIRWVSAWCGEHLTNPPVAQ